MRKLELLAPARDLACGVAAIDHGADAVYIGASKFGARASAGNSVADIRELCLYAHQFGARVYVTVNTILYDDELEATKDLLRQLCEIRVDALLVQDMAVQELLPANESYLPALHASTQTDNRSAEKVAWLQGLGFERAVLARELSLDEISSIHKAVPGMELEAFVHGALCVSYSGVCYASQYCFRRSANRGECAQFCRMPFDLVDADGREVVHQRHLLSLKDLNRIDHLEELADAGVCSFKIEGRLKGTDYVKNVVAAYSQRLDQVIARRRDDYCRASLGKMTYHFEPNLKKTFNRGFTDYFLHRRRPDIFSPDTPKALGEYVGKVKLVGRGSFTVSGTASFANGDGLCFVNDDHELEGFRVNRAEGNRLFPLAMPGNLRAGLPLYRNNDEAFGKVLAGKTAERRIPITLTLAPADVGFMLTAEGRGICRAEQLLEMEKQPARMPQRENMLRQLQKLGGTPYWAEEVRIEGGAEQYFIPSSALADLRRKVVGSIVLENDTSGKTTGQRPVATAQLAWHPEYKRFPYLYNISNPVARAFYERQGLRQAAGAYETSPPRGKDSGKPAPVLVMQCRHCIRYSLGHCVARGGSRADWKEPLALRLGDGRMFRLEFRCDECQMNVYAGE